MYLARTDNWYLERIIWLVAGIVILSSVALAWFVSPLWLILTTLVGVNLIILGTLGFCPMAIVLNKLGAKPKLARDNAVSCAVKEA